ncbi:hypothetical protein FRB99_001564 [Tulasnella sp. 403]|nr:hypothetical protein FRB99_001564 [Tulasnella sp. 403]
MTFRFTGRLFLQASTPSSHPPGTRFHSNIQSLYHPHHVLTLNVHVGGTLETPPPNTWVDVEGTIVEGTKRMMANLHATVIKVVTGYQSGQVSTRGEFTLNGTVHRKHHMGEDGLVVELLSLRKWYALIPLSELSDEEYAQVSLGDDISATGDFLGLTHRSDATGPLLMLKPTKAVESWINVDSISSSPSPSTPSPPPSLAPVPGELSPFVTLPDPFISPGPSSSPLRVSGSHHPTCGCGDHHGSPTKKRKTMD